MTRKPLIILTVCAAALFGAALEPSAGAPAAPGVHGGPAAGSSASAASAGSAGVVRSDICGDDCLHRPLRRAAQIQTHGHNCAIERRAAGNKSPIKELAAGAQLASPIPTPNRAANIEA